MIKTLRITSILAAIAAAVLIKYFVFPMVVGTGGDPRVDKVLDEPTVVDQFRQTTGAVSKGKVPDVSPLVKQAIAFAGYLNPKPVVGTRKPGGTKGPLRPPVGPTSPKFTVCATTYFAGNPELSQVLIDEPGRDRRWVRQASMVGHLFIEQVKDGVVIVKSSKDTYELEVAATLNAAPAKKTSPISRSTRSQSPVRRSPPTYSRALPGAKSPSKLPAQPDSAELARREAVTKDLVDKLTEKRMAMKPAERARLDDLLSYFDPARAAAKGAESPTKPVEKAKSGDADPNRASSLIKGGKIDTGAVKPPAASSK
jgi:hypothetical protein